MGIITACIPTLRPLFSRATRYPWSKNGWSRKVRDNSAQPHGEENHRLHKVALHTIVPTVPPDLSTSISRNEVAIVAGSTRPGFGGNSSSRNGESRDGFVGTDEGIMENTGFAFDSRSSNEAVSWFDGNRKHKAQEALIRCE